VRLLLATLAAVLFSAAPAAAASQPFGGVSQLPGSAGCVSDDGSGGQCSDGRGLAGVSAVTAYRGLVFAASPTSGTVTVFQPGAQGELTQTSCLSDAPVDGCTQARALAGASDVAVSGSQVYVAARDADAVAVLRLTGDRLEQPSGPAGCVAVAIVGCGPARALDGPVSLVFGERGLLVASRESDAVASFMSGGVNGELVQTGCIQQGDGSRDGCAPGRALEAPSAIAKGYAAVFVASTGSNAVAVLNPDGTQLPDHRACIAQGGAEGCTAGQSLGAPAGVAASREDVFVTAAGSGVLTRLRRGSDGSLSQAAVEAVPGGAGVALHDPEVPPPADSGSYARSHVYAASRALASVATFSIFPSGLAALPPTGTLRPGGAPSDVALLDDHQRIVAFAAVPDAGALLTLKGNLPPRCGTLTYFSRRIPVFKVPADTTTRVPLACYDDEPLQFSVASVPRHGAVERFDGDAALYRPARGYVGLDEFGVRASDGAETAQDTLRVEVQPPGSSGKGPRVALLSRKLRLDRRGIVALRLLCPASEPSRCSTNVQLRRRASRVARGALRIRPGRTRTLRVKLARRARGQVRRSRSGVRLTVRIVAVGLGGATGRTSATVRVRR